MSTSRPKYTTLLLDMDGVLAEVSKSYRAAIIKTCHQYGATSVNHDKITEWKVRGNANDDWKLSRDLILDDPNGDKTVSLQQVTETFEQYYQGTESTPGLHTLETLIPKRSTLENLQQRSQPGVAIVTGRPKADCLQFLRAHSLESLASVLYCMEDGPSKPHPFPVQRACAALKIAPSRKVVLVGDTPDDVRAAVAAGCSAVGVVTPEQFVLDTEHWKLSPICVAMMEAGADALYEPGFEGLLQEF